MIPHGFLADDGSHELYPCYARIPVESSGLVVSGFDFSLSYWGKSAGASD